MQGQGIGGVEVELGGLVGGGAGGHLGCGQLGGWGDSWIRCGAEREGQAGEQGEEEVGKDGVAHFGHSCEMRVLRAAFPLLPDKFSDSQDNWKVH